MEQSDITLIGKTNFRSNSQKFGIKDKDRLQHIYVIGKSGTGKSTLLENMAISDIERGNGLCIIDPHGDIAEDIIKYLPSGRLQDLIYFNATDQVNPIAFNPLKGIHPKYHHLVASGLVSTFKKIWIDSWGPRMEYILRFTLLTLLCVPDATLLDIQPLLTDKDTRTKALSYIEDKHILSFWQNEFEKYSPTL
jgi:energy-coupling factor transporter ATP-binding protein EcfA2